MIRSSRAVATTLVVTPLLLLLLLLPVASAAPGDQLWTRTWPTPAVPGYEIKSSPVLVRGPGGGLWIGTTGMDGSTRDRDFVLLRYSPGGVLRWALQTGSVDPGDIHGHEYLNDVAVAGDGSAVLTGYIAGAQNRMWTAKVGPLGKRMWARRLVSAVAGGEAAGNAVALDSHRNAYVLGVRNRAGRGKDILLVKYSPKGKLLWTRYLAADGSGDDDGIDIVVDGADRVFVTGNVQTLGKRLDVVVARYTTGGARVWKRLWDGALADDGAHDLAVSRAGLTVACNSFLPFGDSRGVVLKAKRTMRASDKLRATISAVPGLDLSWASVSINAAGDVAAGGTASDQISTAQFAYAKWTANGTAVTFQHYSPIGGRAGCDEVLLAGGALFAAGMIDTGPNDGIDLVSLAPAPHSWSCATTDHGYTTGLAASADRVYVAGLTGEQVMIWTYER